MYTKILAQGTKFGSGTTGLDNPAVETFGVSLEEKQPVPKKYSEVGLTICQIQFIQTADFKCINQCDMDCMRFE